MVASGADTTPGTKVMSSDAAGLACKFHTAKVNEDDLEIWLKESAELAQKFAYAEPVLSATGTA